MSSLDYDEMVELWSLDEDKAGRTVGRALIDKMPLWRAVRMVVVDWRLGARREGRAQIVRSHGASPMDLGGIEAVYDEDDFPARRDRSLNHEARP